jgi:hypothetical protein
LHPFTESPIFMGLNSKYLIRAQEWWSFILPPILFCYYAALLQTSPVGISVILQACLLMATSVVTALTGYFINDWSDMEDDRIASKHNYVAHFPVWLKSGFLPLMTLLFALLWAAGRRWLPDTQLSLYALVVGINILLFILYSLPPFRLKRISYVAPLLDAGYSGTFFYGLAFAAGSILPLPYRWSLLWLLCWGIAKGLRNYLSHLSDDADNDRRSGLTTLATIRSPQRIQLIANLLFPIETGLLLLFFFSLPVIAVGGLLLCLLFMLRWFRDIRTSATMKYEHLNDLHEIWLPLGVLVQLILADSYYIWLLVFHFIFFPQHLPKCFFSVKNGIFSLFNKKPVSLKDLLHGKK